MNFSNSQGYRGQNMNLYNANISRAQVPAPRPVQVPLNAPMVNRIHSQKPGCSACGKKVA